MPKYIDFDIAVRKLGTWYNDLVGIYGSDEDFVKGYAEAMDNLADVPAVDVHEDVEGKWVHMNDKEVKCSRCSLIRNIITQEGWRFCPSCGALMLEDE